MGFIKKTVFYGFGVPVGPTSSKKAFLVVLQSP